MFNIVWTDAYRCTCGLLASAAVLLDAVAATTCKFQIFVKKVFRKTQLKRSRMRPYLLFLFVLQLLIGFPKLFGQSGDFGLNRSELERYRGQQ